MIDGTLHKTEKWWRVKHTKMVHTPIGAHDYKVTLEDAYMDVHPEHFMWLKMFGEEGLKVCFEVETIAAGNNEFDVMDTDVAKLKECHSETKTYSQD